VRNRSEKIEADAWDEPWLEIDIGHHVIARNDHHLVGVVTAKANNPQRFLVSWHDLSGVAWFTPDLLRPLRYAIPQP
jgi:hypothetical protein